MPTEFSTFNRANIVPGSFDDETMRRTKRDNLILVAKRPIIPMGNQ